MSDTVAQIKERLTIEDVVSSYVELHKAGKHFKGKSPFTSEKTPSFYVSPDRGVYYCFSTNQGGDMFNFIQAMEGVDFKESLKMLAEKAGVELVREDPKKRDERERQFAVLEDVTKFFTDNINENPAAKKYVTDRGVTEKTMQLWRLGLAPDEWRAAREYLSAKKYTDLELRQAGLVKGEEGKDPYDVFRNRIMFPMCNNSSKVVAFSGRTLSNDDKSPKYVNSPETDLFKKSEILYGYDKARQGIRKFDFSLIVEGQFDVVLCHQAGYNNTVAVSGTALTPHHVQLLQRLSNRVVLALDADRAGLAAMKKAAYLMLARGMDIKIAPMPEGKDPADMIREDVKQFKDVIGHSVTVIEHLLNVIKASTRDDRSFLLEVRAEVLPLVVRIPSDMEQELFAGMIADKLGMSKDGVMSELHREREKYAKEKEKEPAAAPFVDSPQTGTAAPAVQQAPAPAPDPGYDYDPGPAPLPDYGGADSYTPDDYGSSYSGGNDYAPSMAPAANPYAVSSTKRVNVSGARLQELTDYMVVLYDVLEPAEATVFAEHFKEITGADAADLLPKVEEGVRAKFSVAIEEHFEEMIPKVRRQEIADKLNELRKLTSQKQLFDINAEIKAAEEAGDSDAMMAALSKMDEQKRHKSAEPLTEEVFAEPQKD